MGNSEDFPTKNRQVHRFGVYATVLLGAFLLGFLPMWLTSRTRAAERDAAQQELRVAHIENSLAAAAIQASRGEYENAREAASTFYTNLQAELGRTDSGMAASSRGALQAILAERDQIITLLARSDAAAADRLTSAYTAFRQAVGTLPGQAGPPAVER